MMCFPYLICSANVEDCHDVSQPEPTLRNIFLALKGMEPHDCTLVDQFLDSAIILNAQIHSTIDRCIKTN